MSTYATMSLVESLEFFKVKFSFCVPVNDTYLLNEKLNRETCCNHKRHPLSKAFMSKMFFEMQKLKMGVSVWYTSTYTFSYVG